MPVSFDWYQVVGVDPEPFQNLGDLGTLILVDDDIDLAILPMKSVHFGTQLLQVIILHLLDVPLGKKYLL